MDYLKERQEAIAAGEQALLSLREAERYISSAMNWGIWDILLGKGFVSLGKHFKIAKAKDSVRRAKTDLGIFVREFRDLNVNVDIEIGDLLTVFDLFDNLFVDILVQSKLSDAKIRIEDAISEVERCLRSLK